MLQIKVENISLVRSMSTGIWAAQDKSVTPILGHLNLQHPFTVYTDCSDTGLGAVLTQRKEQGMEEVIAYAWRSLNPAETNYSVTEKECLAVVWALEKWQHCMDNRMFMIVTDHSALQWAMSSTKTTRCHIRWALRLQKFDFVIEVRKKQTTVNAAPDAFPECPTYLHATCSPTKRTRLTFPITAVDLLEEQHKDPEIEKIFKAIAENRTILDWGLYLKTQLLKGQVQYRVYLPKSLIPTILQYYHSIPLSGQWGISKNLSSSGLECGRM